MKEFGQAQTSELIQKPPVEVFASWLRMVDSYGSKANGPFGTEESNMQIQNLTEREIPHPLSQPPGRDLELNIQLAVIVLNELENREHFPEGTAEMLIAGIRRGFVTGQWEGTMSPTAAYDILKAKQDRYLQEGGSWQFAMVGIEVNPTAQRAAYKVHAIQELLEPLANPEAKEYEDHLADILTTDIMQSNFPILRSLFGPVRFSVRWQDFLEDGANPRQHAWVNEVLRDVFPSQTEEIEEILLKISVAESRVTPGTLMQILRKGSSKSTGKTPERFADAHRHENKVEFYLPLEGPGQVKIQYAGEGTVHTYMPDPNVTALLDLTKLGAKMTSADGKPAEPAIVYGGEVYTVGQNERFVNVRVGEDKYVQFILVRPGDIHDFVNVGITPAPAYALTLGFPREEGLSIENDFKNVNFPEAKHAENNTLLV